jgi:hypothetical protein
MAWPLVVLAASAAVSAYGSYKSGEAGKDAAKANQIELNKQAAATEAGSHRRAWDARKTGERQASRATALMVSQGGSTSDPGFDVIVGDINGTKLFNELSILWAGRDKARQLRRSGQIGVDTAKDMAKAQNISTAGSIMSSFASYGMSGGFGGGGAGTGNFNITGGMSPAGYQTNAQKMGFN